MKEPGLYTIACGRPFLDDLAAGLSAISGPAPEDLAGMVAMALSLPNNAVVAEMLVNCRLEDLF